MNIVKYELKKNTKSFFFWMIGLSLLTIYGMLEYSGITQTEEAMTQLMAAFPKIVLVIFGMSGFDITTLIGYYGVLFIYIEIMIAIFALNHGYNTTALEINDKTSEFIYTKPVSRIYVTIMKMLGSAVYLILFVIISYLSVLMGINLNGLENNVNQLLILFHWALLLIGFFFFALGSLLGAINHKKGALIGSLILLTSYIIGIFYDIIDNNQIIRLLTPLKYFDLVKIINSQSLSNLYIIITVLLIIIMLIVSNLIIKQKNIE